MRYFITIKRQTGLVFGVVVYFVRAHYVLTGEKRTMYATHNFDEACQYAYFARQASLRW